MRWYGASQRKGTLSRLQPDGKDVKAVTVYTHLFVMAEDGKCDEQKQPFYMAIADTPEEAEALAFAVYQQAYGCKHQMRRKGSLLSECSKCGIQRRVHLTPAAETPPARKPERRFFNLF